MTHHEKLPPYATLEQALYGVKLCVAYVRSGIVDGLPVDLACAIKGGLTALDFGASHLPHDHPSHGVNYQALNDEELAERLEASTAAQADPAGFPWEVLVPLVIELIRRWLERRRS